MVDDVTSDFGRENSKAVLKLTGRLLSSVAMANRKKCEHDGLATLVVSEADLLYDPIRFRIGS